MDSLKLKNHVHRNGFDLSHKNCFTAKAGELLPIFSREVIPGDKFNIDLSSLTRSMPVASAAYTRLREYFDFYFVPDRLLWRYSDMFFTQMENSSNIATGPHHFASSFEHLPYINTSDVLTIFSDFVMNRNNIVPKGSASVDLLGFDRVQTMSKLLSYLDYGFSADIKYYMSQSVVSDSNTYGVGLPSRPMCPFKLLAYQKIYNDFYRFPQWERNRPYLYNIDYLSKDTPLINVDVLRNLDWSSSDGTMFDLRYANFHKDMFTGVLPEAQYGSPGLASPLIGTQSFNVVDGEDPNHKILIADAATTSSSTDNEGYKMGLSVLSLRMAEFLQRYKEIAISADPDYKSQLEAHWNVHISRDRSDMCQYLGGCANNVDISEVVNTNLASDNVADILGKGVGAINGHINFEAHEHGVIMCIYHVLPLLDYQDYGADRFNYKVFPTDFAIPEMDSIGMEQVSFADFFNRKVYTKENNDLFSPVRNILGYAPRYIDYKTSVDKIHGAFNLSLSQWVSPMSFDFIKELLIKLNNSSPTGWTGLDYTFFKVRSSFLNPIFAQSVTSSVDSDQFLVNSFFDIKAVRNLDVSGLPY